MVGRSALPHLDVVIADITTLAVDAIVNAANSALSGGGGVDGAINRAAGPELVEASRALGPCPPGDVRMTPGFRLKARFVIHAVGPVWDGGGRNEDALLARCYERSLERAEDHDFTAIAFPAISTGAYRFPPARAARIAVTTVRDFVGSHTTHLERVIFCCFDTRTEVLYRALIDEIPE